MRYTITSEQNNYFKKEGYIAFQAFLTKEEAQKLKGLLDEAYAKNASGRDLERGNIFLFKGLKLSRFAQAAGHLYKQKRIKLGFTQYNPFYDTIDALENLSSISECFGWALVNLSLEPLPDFAYLPEEMGDVCFYNKEFPIDFTSIKGDVLMLAFAKETARYVIQEKDPHTHFLKKMGYGSGDILSEETHPLILK